MTYRQRMSLFIIIDSCIVLAAISISWMLIGGSNLSFTVPIVLSFLSVLLSHHFYSVKYKLYKKVWEYASIGELLIIFKIVTFSIGSAVIVQLVLTQELYARLLIVTWLLYMLLIGGSRFTWRIYRDAIINRPYNKARTLIVGAGSAGTMVARQLLNNGSHLSPVAFIDDNVNKHGLDILGIPVVGGVKNIERVVKDLKVGNIIISIPSLSKKELNIIFQECAKTSAQTKILPLLEDLVTGKVSVTEVRDVQVEDLLGRDPVDINIESISESITNQIVLVTGAGGSIGSEIARQIVKYNPRRLILLGHGENSIYEIDMELKEYVNNNKVELVTEIADIQDKHKIMSVMRMYKPDVIYHAAAHKHVPLMEENPEEAVKNNIIGTMNVAEAARWNNVTTFVMISTDKAVHPTSVMGATKRLAEMVIQDMNKHSDTKFVAVRFGNVLGSHGSVIPRFKQQIEKGGPVTVTHPEMVRYFMTIPEASKLVIQAGVLADGGEIFVLDMGNPVKIVDLAKNLIKLSGHCMEDIGIVYTGIRPGEKLCEELLQKNEVHEQQLYPNIYIGKTTEISLENIDKIIKTFKKVDKNTLRMELLNAANQTTMDVTETKSVASI